jgi:hypothetical protein
MTEFRSYPKRRKDTDEPVFLRKTYVMLDESPSDVVGWSHDGLSFIVSNAEKFAEHIIPRYFKHKNLASFVRQLNFYGFRKVKHSRNTGPADDSIIEFKHPQFQKGKPELLGEIKRAAHNTEVLDMNEFNHLKFQVTELTHKVDEMTRTVEELKQMIMVMNSSLVTPLEFDEDHPSKRPRLQEIYDVPDDENLGEEEFDQATIDMLADFDTSFSESTTITQAPSSTMSTNNKPDNQSTSTSSKPLDNDIAIPVAAAALGAFISTYNEANMNNAAFSALFTKYGHTAKSGSIHI